jgi:CubicO group peptidase (beta-lactamase class C family)
MSVSQPIRMKTRILHSRYWLGLLFAVVIAAEAWADELPRARPEELGFSSQRLSQVDRLYQEKVDRGEIAGVVVLIARHGKVAHQGAIGFADVGKRRKMTPDTIFRIYSMTKPITAVALMTLYEEGRFRLTDPLSRFIPEFAQLRVLRHPDGPLGDTVPMEREPTVQDIMRHTGGFTHGISTDAFDAQYVAADVFGLDVSLADMMTRLAKIPLRHQPGTTYAYSVGPDIGARLVEVISGMPFDEFLQRRVFGPLHMKDTGFSATGERAKRLAQVHWSKAGKLIVLDEEHGHPVGGVLVQPWSVNSYTVEHKRKGGSFGLVSTAEDYWRFAQMMLDGGQSRGARILSPHTVRYMTRDHLGAVDRKAVAKGIGIGLGFLVIEDPTEAGHIASDGGYFAGGAAATTAWIDPKEDLVVVALTQHMVVPTIGSDILRAQLMPLVYGTLVSGAPLTPDSGVPRAGE